VRFVIPQTPHAAVSHGTRRVVLMLASKQSENRSGLYAYRCSSYFLFPNSPPLSRECGNVTRMTANSRSTTQNCRVTPPVSRRYPQLPCRVCTFPFWGCGINFDFHYHELHLKSTTEMKLFDLTLSGKDNSYLDK
jgi:hypothetical protein